MKKLTLLSAVALSCCAVSPTFAQVQILRSGTPTPAPRLVSDQPNLVEPLPIDSATAPEAIPNPFDYFDQELPQLIQPETTIEEVQPGFLTEESGVSQNRDQPDPASIPVGRHHRQYGPSVVDTIVSQEMVGNIPNASVTPVFWGGAPQTPNPVAEWLLREECVDGLWANYPQQRAAECAHMWNHIAGRHPCGCASGSCATVSGPCSVCSSHAAAAPRNRYLERSTAAPAGCDNYAQPVPAAACDSCHQSHGAPTADCGQCAQLTGKAPQGQVDQAAPRATKAAKLPTLGWFR